ncbi:MAG: thiamine-phosphate kinase [Patulibacter sp.]|nr:thiamine-phosphate kinase [Patulibacter sp.]
MTRRGEFALIDAFRDRLPAPHAGVVVGSGDDAAVVRAGGALSVVSVDTTVDGVHARLELGDPRSTAEAFGWRALTTAVSDLAACGVGPGPVEAYVAVTLPPSLGDERVLAISDGMAAAARAYGVSVIGGDVTSGPAVVISTTVVGWLAEGEAPLTRAGAKPGDLVGLTGPVGAGGAGLALFLGDVDPAALPSADAAALTDRYLRPVPHLQAGAALRVAGATAAIDLSDGLLADACHVARASGVALRVEADRVPLARGVDAAALQLGLEPLLFAQSAGEDFVLLVTVPQAARAAAEAAGVVAWIGTVAGGPAGEVSGLPDDPTGRTGHDHRG